MRSPWKALAALAVVTVLLPAAQVSVAARALAVGAPPALRHSLNLWATLDVCIPPDQPETVGVRGSMPGDKVASDEIYMRFRLQYVDASGGRWVDLAGGSSPGFIKVGSARTARQDGWSFQLKPAASRRMTILRGVVTFQWRRGATVIASISRPTTAGHESLAGGDPPNFTAATCTVA